MPAATPTPRTPASVATSGVSLTLRSRPTKCYVRVAPLEAAKGQRAASSGAANADIRVHAASSGEPILSLPEFMSKKGYRTKSTLHRCDGVFDGACDAELYQTVGAPLVELALNGSSSCVFAYGQTGTGKSYNLWRVVLPAMADALYAAGATVQVAAQQLYCDRIEDILPSQARAAGKGRSTFAAAHPTSSSGDTSGLHWTTCTSASHLRYSLAAAAERVKTGSTLLNAMSSRSHTLVHLRVQCPASGEGAAAVGQLVVVDLAGSERLKKSGSSGVQQQEAIAINASLHALSQVIEALGRKKAHVPTRGNQLTQLLDPYLRGGERLHLLVCISPLADHLSESVQSLQVGACRSAHRTATPLLLRMLRNPHAA